MPKITKHLVEAAEIRDKHYTITDSQIPGFGIRIMRGGTGPTDYEFQSVPLSMLHVITR